MIYTSDGGCIHEVLHLYGFDADIKNDGYIDIVEAQLDPFDCSFSELFQILRCFFHYLLNLHL